MRPKSDLPNLRLKLGNPDLPALGEELETIHKKFNKSPSHRKGATATPSNVVRAMANVVYAHYTTLALSEPPKTLAKDGVWLVGPDERPKGWEKMGLKEPENMK